MAGSVEEKWSIDKLDGSNWSTWKFQIKHLLLAKGLWEYVDGTAVLDEDADDRVQAEFNQKSKGIFYHCYGYQYESVVSCYII